MPVNECFNFYDGADLNLFSTTIFLFGFSLINYPNLIVPSLILISFSIGFSLINRKKDSLYLGIQEVMYFHA